MKSDFQLKLGTFLWKLLQYTSLVLFGFIAVFPVVSCVITAFKPESEYKSTTVMSLPENWLYFGNFVTAWQKSNMGRAFLNSTIIVIFVVFGSVMIGSMLAYVLSRFKFRGNGTIRNLFLYAALIPGIAMQIPLYKMMNTIHFNNSIPGYIILMMGTDVISIYIFIQFFENISTSLDESAIMDGASYFTIFFKILFPLLRPAVVTVMILKGVGVYNEYYSANLYLQKSELRTVALALYTFVGPMKSQYNLICAGVLITLTPALIIFILFQKQIYNGLTTGAVKG